MPSAARSRTSSSVAWLESLSPWPTDGFGTERMLELLERLGDPQRSFRAVHVVGTKGKSTAARRIARTIGGPAYTSPHVAGWHERLDTDPDGFERAVARVRADAQAVGATQFEALTAAAFADFAERDASVAAVEAGLGGRHDATNVIDAPVVLLTNVDLEHTDVLGDTREQIATEKLAVAGTQATVVLPDDEFAYLVPGAVQIGGAEEAAEAFLGRRIALADALAPRPARAPRRRGARRCAHARGGRLAARAAACPRRLRRRRLDPRRQGRRRRFSSGSPGREARSSRPAPRTIVRCPRRPSPRPGERCSPPWKRSPTRSTPSRGRASSGRGCSSPARSTCLPISPEPSEMRTMSRAGERISVFLFALFLLALFVGARVRGRLRRRKDAPVIASTFSGVHDFFHSSTWYVIRNLAVFFVVVFWLATVYWVYKDARRRIEDMLIVWVATLLGVVPFIGPLIYMLFRPPEYLDDVRERELEIRAMEKRLGGRDLHCPVCRAEVDDDFLDLPRLHDEAAAGVHVVPPPARGALADLPVLRDPDRSPTTSRSPSPTRRRERLALAAKPGNFPRRMAVERTLILAKPDAVERNLAGEILARFERRGLDAARRTLRDREPRASARRTTRSTARSRSSASSSTSSPRARRSRFVLEGEGAIATCRKTIGATNPADADPGLAARRVRARDAEQPRPRLRLARVGRARDRDLVPRWAGRERRTAQNARALDRSRTATTPTRTPTTNWALDEISWGIWGIDEIRAERPRRRRRARRRRARLRHRVLLGLAREARRAADRRRHHAGAARDRATA